MVTMAVDRDERGGLAMTQHAACRKATMKQLIGFALLGLAAAMVGPVQAQSSSDASLDELPQRPDKAKVAQAASEARGGGREYRDALHAGGQGPEMVVIPAGHFTVGSPSDEDGRNSDEGPAHEVTIGRFALGKYPVTKGEFAAFVDATGYRTDAEKNTAIPGIERAVGCYAYKGGAHFGWKAGTSWRDLGYSQDDSHPATCLSWNDAVAYVEWLAHETGKPYRLPSEAESEYATRAGTTSPYPWGADAEQACQYGNVGDAMAKGRFPGWPTTSCSDGYVFTSPVGHFRPNVFGLYDMIGNVWKWTQDCHADDDNGAPRDASAPQTKGCDLRVLRGASWANGLTGLRSAHRARLQGAYRGFNTGLRVAQDL